MNILEKRGHEQRHKIERKKPRIACLEDNQFNRHFYPVAVIMKSGSYVKYKDTRMKSAKNNNKGKYYKR